MDSKQTEIESNVTKLLAKNLKDEKIRLKNYNEMLQLAKFSDLSEIKKNSPFVKVGIASLIMLFLQLPDIFLKKKNRILYQKNNLFILFCIDILKTHYFSNESIIFFLFLPGRKLSKYKYNFHIWGTHTHSKESIGKIHALFYKFNGRDFL
jgi:hypothetical protein